MASITSVSAGPTTIATSGGTSTISPVISDPDKTATVTIQVDNTSGTAVVDLHENLAFSVNVADIGKPGYVVATVDQGGSLAVAPNGVGFIFTAS